MTGGEKKSNGKSNGAGSAAPAPDALAAFKRGILRDLAMLHCDVSVVEAELGSDDPELEEVVAVLSDMLVALGEMIEECDGDVENRCQYCDWYPRDVCGSSDA